MSFMPQTSPKLAKLPNKINAVAIVAEFVFVNNFNGLTPQTLWEVPADSPRLFQGRPNYGLAILPKYPLF